MIQIEFTNEFKRNLRALSKKYRNIKTDLYAIIERIHQGEFIGDKIQGTKRIVFKIRIKNSDIQKGKSGG